MLTAEAVQALARGDPAWLREKRARAWRTYAASPAQPFQKYGLSITTPLEGFDPQEAGNGGTVQVSAPAGVEAGAEDERLFSLLPSTRLAALHQAFARALVIRVPEGTELRQPIVIRRDMGGPTFFEHVLLVVGNHCSLTVLESLQGQGSFHSGGCEILLGEGSSLLLGSTQTLAAQTRHVSFKRALLGASSSLRWVNADLGGAVSLLQLDAGLQGPGASLHLQTMAYGTGEQHFDYNAAARHLAPDTSSTILHRAALDGRAKMVFNGLVRIAHDAARASGSQKEDTLLLSPEAEAAPIPSLEIDTNDVRCSHATTVGQVDRDTLFYLMARGLTEEQATRLVVQGFFEPLLASLPLPSLQQQLREQVDARLRERGESILTGTRREEC